MNPVDTRTDQIADEIRANYENEDDTALRSDLQFHAACFRCAVLENKLKAADEMRLKAEGKL